MIVQGETSGSPCRSQCVGVHIICDTDTHTAVRQLLTGYQYTISSAKNGPHETTAVLNGVVYYLDDYEYFVLLFNGI